MSVKRILVVDDDKNILRMLEFGLKKMGAEFEVFTAKDMFDALNHIEHHRFDLVLTDYMMPGMTGVDLARALHKLSPETQVVLMTAFGNTKLRETTTHIGFDGYLDKPFDIEDIRRLVKQSSLEAVPLEPVGESAAEDAPPPPATPAKKTVDDLLDNLLVNAGARAVMLIKANGNPVKTVGQIDQKKITGIAALVASSFLRTSELAGLLDNRKMFKAGLYEGDAYNLYVCDVNEESLLAVIFDVKLRPGVVWFYSKQTAAELLPLLQPDNKP
ncbi:MAG: hypothetical protein Kow0031_39410 [Anaerolineae bacterium]